MRSYYRFLIYIAIIIATTPSHAAYFDYLQPLPTQALIPESNPQTDAKLALGKLLFNDKRLSAQNNHSCNDCHNLQQGATSKNSYAVTVANKSFKRNPPTLLNIGLQTVLYWDGRATSLEAQTLDHLQDKHIMANKDSDALLKKLAADSHYQKAFSDAFSTSPAISLDHLAMAIASFERALMTPDSPFDRFIKGDKKAISAKAQEGIKIFNNTGCLACHFGVNFAGPAPGPAMGPGDGFYELFPNNRGTRYDASHHLTDDLGRFEFSNDSGEKYMWRVPPLRNIALTAPYFHNGSAKTLREAVKIMAKTQTNKVLSRQQLDAVVAFLNSLTGKTPAIINSATPAKSNTH